MVDIVPEERAIIHGLLRNSEFSSTTLQLIKASHFKDRFARMIFEEIVNASENRTAYTEDEVLVSVSGKKMSPEDREYVNAYLENAGKLSTEFLLSSSEEYCRNRGILNGLIDSVEINDSNGDINEIPEIMSDAIAFSFNLDLALDYKNDIDERVDSYLSNETKIPFKLSMMNKITNGGMEKKALIVGLAPTGFGKTIWMADDALYQANRGLNVVYYTFEMDSTRIAKRIDANDLDMTMGDVERNKFNLKEKFEKQQDSMKGNLFFKEFAPDCTTAANLAQHVKRLERSKGLKIDIVYVDYLNLMVSATERNSAGTYKKIEGIAKELIRHIAKGFAIPCVTCTQATRGAQTREATIVDVAESQGLANTVDFLFSMYETPELKQMMATKFKQLKNRFGSLDYYNSFLIGLDRSKMRFFDVDESLSKELLENVDDVEDKPVADQSEFMRRTTEDSKPKQKFGNGFSF